jgi:hypothetical protein
MSFGVVAVIVALLKSAGILTIGILATIGLLAVLMISSFNPFVGTEKTSAFNPKDTSIQHGGFYNFLALRLS